MLWLQLKPGGSMAAKSFLLGQRVRVKTSRRRGQTGTIIGRGWQGVRKVWLVELDVADAFGDRMFKAPDRKLEPLSPEQDPRVGRSMR
jgi:hypothetical protein